MRAREGAQPKREFSVHGYVGRRLALKRTVSGREHTHCLTILWPDGGRNTAGQECRVAEHLDPAWFRAITNTLERVPWTHVTLLRRVVIDDRPTSHGVAPFNRQNTDDARDGHTIWLHEHLFRGKNHWMPGNYGSYWAYHANQNGVAFDNAPHDHAWFSPILLHELGHLVMYGLVNRNLPPEDVSNPPECAKTCVDSANCADAPPSARERGCISPYCLPFRFPASTENWAEQYRFYYQSALTRRLLSVAEAGCLNELRRLDTEGEALAVPPWEHGLPDIATFPRSRWDSCGKRACKGW